MAGIPPFHRPEYDVAKIWYANGVHKYDLVDRITRQPVKYIGSGVSAQDAIVIYSKMGIGQQVHTVNNDGSFGIPGASGLMGSTGQGVGTTGDAVPQPTTG
jgi:hypothetical protein